MPFYRPTRDALRTNLRAYAAARLAWFDPTLKRSTLGILLDACAGAIDGLYGFIAQIINRVLLLDTAEGIYLERQGYVLGITRNGATTAGGYAIATGTSGLSIPTGTLLQTSDGVLAFTTQTTITPTSSGVSVAVVATAASAGSAGNLAAGAQIHLQTAIAGVSPTLTVDSSGLTGGADAETDDHLRARIIARKSQPPQGGCANDYLAWIKASSSAITRAWVYPLNRGAGTVDVAFVLDGRTNIIPQTADITATLAYLATVRPVTANVGIVPLTGDTLSVTVAHLVISSGAVSATVQAAILAQLQALIATCAPPNAYAGDGISVTNTGGTLYLEQISAAVAQAVGVVSFDLAAPTADVVSAAGHIISGVSVAYT